MDNPVNTPNQGNSDLVETTLPRKKLGWIIALIVLIVAGIVGWMIYRNSLGFISTDNAFIDANRMTVSAKILGRIAELSMKEGDPVSYGQILVKLDDSDLKAQLEQAKTAIVLASENIKLAKVSEARAEEDLLRSEKLSKDNAITREQLDHANKELEAAHARNAIAIAQENSAKSQLNVVETQLKNTTVVSQMSGIVAKRWLLPGDVVQPGQAIYSLYDLENVWVTANFEETKLHSIKLDVTAEMMLDAFPGIVWHGKVYQLGSNTASQFSLIPPNNASGNFTKVTQRVPVKISIEHENNSTDRRLLPGMSVEVKLKVG